MYQCPYKWVTGVTTPIKGVMGPYFFLVLSSQSIIYKLDTLPKSYREFEPPWICYLDVPLEVSKRLQ